MSTSASAAVSVLICRILELEVDGLGLFAAHVLLLASAVEEEMARGAKAVVEVAARSNQDEKCRNFMGFANEVVVVLLWL